MDYILKSMWKAISLAVKNTGYALGESVEGGKVKNAVENYNTK